MDRYFAIYYKNFNFMKKLELNQMEKINAKSCETSFAGALVSSSSAIVAIALASNPVGWGIAALSIVGMSLAHYNFYTNDDCLN